MIPYSPTSSTDEEYLRAWLPPGYLEGLDLEGLLSTLNTSRHALHIGNLLDPRVKGAFAEFPCTPFPYWNKLAQASYAHEFYLHPKGGPHVLTSIQHYLHVAHRNRHPQSTSFSDMKWNNLSAVKDWGLREEECILHPPVIPREDQEVVLDGQCRMRVTFENYYFALQLDDPNSVGANMFDYVADEGPQMGGWRPLRLPGDPTQEGRYYLSHEREIGEFVTLEPGNPSAGVLPLVDIQAMPLIGNGSCALLTGLDGKTFPVFLDKIAMPSRKQQKVFAGRWKSGRAKQLQLRAQDDVRRARMFCSSPSALLNVFGPPKDDAVLVMDLRLCLCAAYCGLVVRKSQFELGHAAALWLWTCKCLHVSDENKSLESLNKSAIQTLEAGSPVLRELEPRLGAYGLLVLSRVLETSETSEERPTFERKEEYRETSQGTPDILGRVWSAMNTKAVSKTAAWLRAQEDVMLHHNSRKVLLDFLGSVVRVEFASLK